MKPGIKDVAKVAGVSPTTVSRVLNNRGYISEETRKKVMEIAEELNYVPVKETIRGFKAILDGEMDEYPENAFFNVGTIEDVIAKAKAEGVA